MDILTFRKLKIMELNKMRPATEEENELYNAMLKKTSIPLDFNIFDLPKINDMKLDEIVTEIIGAFQEWETLSAKMSSRYIVHDNDWPDFQAVGIYVLFLANMAYEAGKAENPKNCFEDAAEQRKSGYLEGFDAAAKDPKAWYVLDKNGEQVHIGDWIINGDGQKEIVDTLGDGFVYVDESIYRSNEITKVEPDTREKIKEEMAERIAAGIHDGLAMDAAEIYAEEFIARIEALEE